MARSEQPLHPLRAVSLPSASKSPLPRLRKPSHESRPSIAKQRDAHQRNSSRINTCETVSKQRTLTVFRINTYTKTRGKGGNLACSLWQNLSPVIVCMQHRAGGGASQSTNEILACASDCGYGGWSVGSASAHNHFAISTVLGTRRGEKRTMGSITGSSWPRKTGIWSCTLEMDTTQSEKSNGRWACSDKFFHK
jgi:hypothetical protein